MEHYLVFDEGYNKSAASELVAQFKDTAAFAGIFGPPLVVDKNTDKDENAMTQNGSGTGAAGIKPPAPASQRQVKMMDGERVVFTEESNPQVYLKLVASGDLDELLLEALDDFVKRQRKRLKVAAAKEETPAQN